MKYIRISNELPKELVDQLTAFIKGFGGKYDAGIFLVNDKSFKNLLMEIQNKFVNINGISLGKLIEINKVHMKDIVEVEKDPFVRRSELQKAIEPLVTRDELHKALEPLVTRDELHKTIKDATKDLVTRSELKSFELRIIELFKIGLIPLYAKLNIPLPKEFTATN